jgi:glycosyltransferase involved in cell wall biosynthesis
MRFLVLTQYFPPETGAPQIRLAAMIRELLRLGHSVEVVTALPNYPEGQIFPNYRGSFHKLEQWEGVKVHRVWLYAATGAGIKRLLNYFSFVLTAWWGLRQAQRPDYLFVESPPLFLGITGYLAARRWRIPFIFNIADLWPDTVRGLGLMRTGWVLRLAEKLEIWLYQRADYITVVTESVRQILIKSKSVPAAKVLLLPNGVDTQLFKPQVADEVWRASLGLPPDQPLLLYAGTHGYAHGMEVILQAAQLLKATNILFLLVGGGSDKPRIQQLSEQMQLHNVRFWSPQPPEFIARLYSLSIAGISTFRDSPWLACTRAAKTLPILACGKPVLLCGAGEGAHLITEANAGIVISPEDYHGLAQAIQQLLNNPTYAEQLGNQGRNYAEKHLQWSIVVADWLRQLQRTTISFS